MSEAYSLMNSLGEVLEKESLRIREIPDEEFSKIPDSGKWNKKEILGHLIDSAHNNLRRFIITQYESSPHVVYDQNEWVFLNGYREMEKEDVIQFWVLLNKRILRIWSVTPDQNWKKLCDSGKGEADLHSLGWLAEDYITHMKHHLRQL